MPDLERYSLVAREAVLAASAVTRDVQARLDEVRAITKDDRSPVTVADLAAQAVVAHVLREKLGSGAMVGEEDALQLRDPACRGQLEQTLAAARVAWSGATEDDLLEAIDLGNGDPSASGFWTLDPIDGTKGFLRGQQYAISLGWIEDGECVCGAVACPNLPLDHDAPLDGSGGAGSCYRAIGGAGLFESECETGSDERRLEAAADNGSSITVCASVEKAHSSVSDTDRLLEKLAGKGFEIRSPKRLDSQAKYAVIARGQADVYLRLPTRKGYEEKIWDHAAGTLVAIEGGRVITDIRGRPLDFSQGETLRSNLGVVGASAASHGAIIEAIRELGIGAD